MTLMIETNDLRRTFKTKGKADDVEAVRGVDLKVEAGGDLRLPRPERRRQDDHPADAGHPAGADVGDGHGRRRRPGPRIPARSGSASATCRRAGRPIRPRPGAANSSSRAGCTAWTRRARRDGRPRSSTDWASSRRPIGTSSTYSGGMRRRLDVGLGIVHRPAVLFLDEPTTGLDPQARAGMWDEIRSLRDVGTTVFLTTHYLEEADALADRLAIIDHGRIVAEGTADELKRQVAGDVITIGVDGGVEHVLEAVRAQPFVREASQEGDLVRLYVDQGDVAVPQLIRVLDGAGLQAQTLTLARPSLDDVFLRQTGRSLRDEAAA